MSAIIFDGKKFSEEILEKLKENRRGLGKLRFDAVLVGDNSASLSFLKEKEKACKVLGVDFKLHKIDEKISNTQLRKEIVKIGKIKSVNGLIIQLPLPSRINAQYILNAIPEEKDIDVLSQKSLGAFYVGRSKILPPTVSAFKKVLDYYQNLNGGSIADKKFLVIGAGGLVGRPIAVWLTNQDYTFSVITEKTKDMTKFTKEADIVVSGAGKPNLITVEIIKQGAVIIDFGFGKIDGKIFGDFDESVKEKSGFLTPVPGGMGPVTVACLLENLLNLAKPTPAN